MNITVFLDMDNAYLKIKKKKLISLGFYMWCFVG